MQGIARLLAHHRRHPIFARLGHKLVEWHRSFENLNYDLNENGERFVLERIAAVSRPGVLFDVGANVGDWSDIAAGLFPQSRIYAFEIVPQTHRHLHARFAGKPNVQPLAMGLADFRGATQVNYWPQGSGVSTCLDGFVESFHHVAPGQKIHARVTTGDLFCREQAINQIDFLKIDVEGMEDRVLEGFSAMLQAGAVKALQFEYGYSNIVSKFLLKDFYELLTARNMVIGKIYPDYVDFRDYHFEHEDFIGPNYLAVHRSQRRIIDALSA